MDVSHHGPFILIWHFTTNAGVIGLTRQERPDVDQESVWNYYIDVDRRRCWFDSTLPINNTPLHSLISLVLRNIPFFFTSQHSAFLIFKMKFINTLVFAAAASAAPTGLPLNINSDDKLVQDLDNTLKIVDNIDLTAESLDKGVAKIISNLDTTGVLTGVPAKVHSRSAIKLNLQDLLGENKETDVEFNPHELINSEGVLNIIKRDIIPDNFNPDAIAALGPNPTVQQIVDALQLQIPDKAKPFITNKRQIGASTASADLSAVAALNKLGDDASVKDILQALHVSVDPKAAPYLNGKRQVGTDLDAINKLGDNATVKQILDILHVGLDPKAAPYLSGSKRSEDGSVKDIVDEYVDRVTEAAADETAVHIAGGVTI